MNRKKTWVYSPKKIMVPVPSEQKEKIQELFETYAKTILSKYVRTFNPRKKSRQCVGFYSIWRRNYFYMGAHIQDPRENVIFPEYKEPCARIEYRGPDLYFPAYLRHTGEYQEISYGKKLPFKGCLKVLEDHLIFHYLD